MYAGKVASSEAKDILASLEAARDKTIKEAYKEAAEKQKQALATELAAVRAATDAKVALMKEGISKQLTQEEVAYRRRVADLKKRLETEKGLTKKAKAAIQQQIELAEQQHVLNVEKINRAREMMRRHIGDNLPPEEIARRLNIGYTWFRRTFRAYVGIAPAQYQLQLRHNKARELLTTTDRTVSEIAAELGFENVSQFSAFFRQREKITATQYRSKYGF